MRRDKFYIDLELPSEEEISYQLTQVTPLQKLTEENKEEWYRDFFIAKL